MSLNDRLEAWMLGCADGFTHTDAVAWLRQQPETPTLTTPWYRVVDRAQQRLRRRGAISFVRVGRQVIWKATGK